jgi:DNA-binding ferritin-like protein
MKTLSSNINLFLGLHTQLKIFHWQTKGHARHELFAKVRDTFEGLMDEFVEQAMGQYGRFELGEENDTIKMMNLSQLKPTDLANTICESLVDMTNQINPQDTNLLNLRDEMLGLIQKMKYLLTQE